MFFKSMKGLLYPIDDNQIVVTDIFKRVGLKKPVVGKLALEKYYIDDGSTPEDIAKIFYNNVFYHWVILVVNDIVNVYEEWPKPEAALLDYVRDKYGADTENYDHHYALTEDTSIIVDYNAAKIASTEYVAISNYQYELELNENKRQISILRPDYLKEFVTQHTKLMAI